MPRRFAFRIATVLGVILVMTLLFELGLRFLWTPFSLRTTRATGPHPVYRAAPLPSVRGVIAEPEFEHRFRHSAQGMRGTDVIGPRADPDERRVLFLGDSFTYGVGAADDEIFVALLRDRWTDVVVANAGCNGYGTREELAVLDRLGPRFAPDLTVLVFFWNDLEDNLTREVPDFALTERGSVRRVDEAPPLDPLALRGPPPPAAVGRPTFYLGSLLRHATRALRYRVLGAKPRDIADAAQRDHAWTVTRRLLAAGAARAREIGTRLVVVSIPDPAQVDPGSKIRNIGPLQYDVQAELQGVCVQLGLRCIDLLPGLRERARGTDAPFFYYVDRHLTPAGNRAVAELLQEPLRDELRSARAR